MVLSVTNKLFCSQPATNDTTMLKHVWLTVILPCGLMTSSIVVRRRKVKYCYLQLLIPENVKNSFFAMSTKFGRNEKKKSYFNNVFFPSTDIFR